MKKAFTILMLVLILLNVLGFYGIFQGLKFSYEQQTRRDLDDDKYAGADVITFAVPLTVPYYTSPTPDYVRVDGEFERNGESYRLVKQKLYRDTLYIVCVKDPLGNKINREITDYVKTFTDKPMNAKQSGPRAAQSFCKDYLPTLVSIESGHEGWGHVISFVDPKDHYRYLGTFEFYTPPKQISAC